MTPEEFESELETIPPETIEVPIEENPPEYMQSRISPQIADQLVFSKQVAKALCNGMSIAEIAERLGVSDQVVRRRVNSAPMADLLEIEARRVVRHLAGRELDKEKYLGLSTAVCGMIDKIRLLRDEPTDITEHTVSQDTINRIKIGLHGLQHRTVSAGAGSTAEALAGADAEPVLQVADEA